MGVKNVFKKIWKGIKVVAPFLETAAAFLPGGSPVVGLLHVLSAIVERAEDEFPAAGSGVQKAEYFTLQGMKVAEAVTGKNFDSPEGRALLAEYAAVEVEVRNAQARYVTVAAKVKAYVESVKEPAKDDTETTTTTDDALAELFA